MRFSRSTYLLSALFILVVLSRLPFLLPGYGIEEDSWAIALAALRSHASGIYHPSRFPGHPTQEIILSLLVKIGPWGFNFLSALFSGVTVIFFALILQKMRFQNYLLAALAFAFVPVIYISSTYTIDFMWTEALVLASMFFVLDKKYIVAGVFLGLAVGCRITSGAMLLPFMIFIWQPNQKKISWWNSFLLGITTVLVSIVCFLPLMRQYGLSFFMYYDQFPYPPIGKVFYKMLPGVFGFVGLLAIVAAAFIIFSRRNTGTRSIMSTDTFAKKMMLASWLIIVLYSISYFRLPQKSGYMIPVIPFVIYLAGYYLGVKQFRIFCVALLISPFVLSINLTDKLRGAEYSPLAVKATVSGQEIFLDPLSGPVFSDRSKRWNKMKYSQSVLDRSSKITDSTVVIAGWWYNQLLVMSKEQPVGAVYFEGYIDHRKMKDYAERGCRITYLPEQEIYNDLMFRIKTTRTFAQPFEEVFSN
jgi:hypothetical protein